MGTFLNLESFDPKYAPALVFSLFEGLRSGCSIMLRTKDDMKALRSLFKEAGIENVSWSVRNVEPFRWEVEIQKTA